MKMTGRSINSLLLILASVALSACGSLNTLPRSDEEVASNLKRHQTKCTYVPQVYSGVAYDFCRMHAEYNSAARSTYPDVEVTDKVILNHRRDTQGRGLALLLAADFVLSGVVDTFALPYTVYKQSKDGSVIID